MHRILNWLLGFLENFSTLNLNNIKKKSASTSQRTQFRCIMNTNRLMLLGEIITISVGHTAHTNAEGGYNAKLLVLSVWYMVTDIASAVSQSAWWGWGGTRNKVT